MLEVMFVAFPPINMLEVISIPYPHYKYVTINYNIDPLSPL